MTRDMELIRKALMEIEKQVDNVAVFNLKIDGYTMEQIAYHCSILYDAGMVHSYKGSYGSGELYAFGVGRLTWEGHEFLDKIRSDTIWNKTKDVIAKHGLPMVIDVVKDIATSIISSVTEGVIRGLIQ